MAMLFIPNLLWTKYQPEGYTAAHESKVLSIFEKVGQVCVTCAALIFSDFNLHPLTLWSLWLFAAFLTMVFYELWWVRYFRSGKSMMDFYSSFVGIPVAGAALPVIAFFLLGIYGKVIWMLIAVTVLGIGHIGIHLQHRKEISH